jgi:signal transduction histidine kinase
MTGPRTLRAKLTLTAIAVIGGALCLMGVAVDVIAGKTLTMSIDSELRRNADRIVERHRDFLAHRPDGGRPPGPFRPPPKERFSALEPRFIRIAPDSDVPATTSGPFDEAAVRMAEKGHESFKTTSYRGESIRVLTVPLLLGRRIDSVVQVPYSMADVDAALATLRVILLTLIPVAAVLAAGAARFLIDRLLRPLYNIASAADAVGARNHTDRIAVVGDDEFAFLGRTLNRMLDRLASALDAEQATSRELEASLERQKRFSADASHELKTPVAVVKANSSMLLHSNALPADCAECIKDIDAAADRMDHLVRELMVLAKAESSFPSATREPCCVGAVVAAAVKQSRPGTAAVSVVPGPDLPPVAGIFEELVRLVENLVDNAQRHASASKISVSTRLSGDDVEVEVADDGVGIAPEHLPHLFERFYRVDPSRSSETGGTGLGLAISKGIAEAHKGTIRVESGVGKGTTFTVVLPVSG